MRKLRLFPALIGVALLSASSSAKAHDFWLQPRSYHVPQGASIPLTIEVGHGSARQRWSGQLERVIAFKEVGPQGVADHRSELRTGGGAEDALVRFSRPGTQVLVFQSTPAESDLPAIRFNEYAKFEGLTPALDYRARTKTTDAPGREIYSRRAKALVEVGAPSAASDRQVVTPVGLTLEIVPERNPYTLKPKELLPVRVLYEGRPLPGALVKLTNLEFDARPLEMHLTDAAGRAAFDVPRTGTWLVNVIWTKRITGNPKGDFDTTFSSLTFAFPPKLAAR